MDLGFKSKSHYLEKTVVQQAICNDSNVALLACQFDTSHLDVERRPFNSLLKHEKALKKRELMLAVDVFYNKDVAA